MTAAISIDRLSKLYRLGQRQGEYRTLRESLMQAGAGVYRRLRRLARAVAAPGWADEAAAPAGSYWALKDISCEIAAGQVVGVIGRNGAGKSTLLKILSRITEPTSGRCQLHGRVGSLLEVGTGFHPELTGRENIYLNGAILGMTRREITRKFDEIVAFAEVDRFLDTPVKRYSSGMYVRLAFAVAAHMESEILLVDEVLAVGDAAFQSKCLGKMGEVSKSGRTVLFVSHNMGTVLSLCERALVLDRGQLSYIGPVAQAVEYYMSSSNTLMTGEGDLSNHPNRTPGSQRIFRGFRLLNGSRKATDQFICGSPLTVELTIEVEEPRTDLHVGIVVEDAVGCRLFTVGTYLTDSVPVLNGKRHRVLCHLDDLPLAPGRYFLSLNAGPFHHQAATDVLEQVIAFEVIAADYYGGGKLPHPNRGRFLMRSRWEAAELSVEDAVESMSR